MRGHKTVWFCTRDSLTYSCLPYSECKSLADTRLHGIRVIIPADAMCDGL